MKITVTDGNSFVAFEVDPDNLIQDLKALIQVEMNVPSNRQLLFYEKKPLQDKQKLSQAQITDNSMILLTIAQNKPKVGIADIIRNFDKKPKNSINQFNIPKRTFEQFRQQAERIRGQIKYDLHRLQQLSQRQPQIANAIKSNNPDDLAHLLMKKHDQRIKKFIDQQTKFMELSKDPMNPQYQRMLQERIHEENIQKNYEFANEYIPQVFASVNMLYINASINKVPIQAFVDSGAQSTIMSESLANKCGLMRLVDKRAAGTAVGVGTCKILGKIHAAQIEIQKKFITCSFTVIENNGVEFLLGLDMLKRFNCILNLKDNTLNFQDGLIITKFLTDGEINKNKDSKNQENIQQKLKKLMSMGFNQGQALNALKSANFNEQVAATILMQNKFGK